MYVLICLNENQKFDDKTPEVVITSCLTKPHGVVLPRAFFLLSNVTVTLNYFGAIEISLFTMCYSCKLCISVDIVFIHGRMPLEIPVLGQSLY